MIIILQRCNVIKFRGNFHRSDEMLACLRMRKISIFVRPVQFLSALSILVVILVFASFGGFADHYKAFTGYADQSHRTSAKYFTVNPFFLTPVLELLYSGRFRHGQVQTIRWSCIWLLLLFVRIQNADWFRPAFSFLRDKVCCKHIRFQLETFTRLLGWLHLDTILDFSSPLSRLWKSPTRLCWIWKRCLFKTTLRTMLFALARKRMPFGASVLFLLCWIFSYLAGTSTDGLK